MDPVMDPVQMSDCFRPSSCIFRVYVSSLFGYVMICPKHSMYGIFTYIGVVWGVNVGIYGIHGVWVWYKFDELLMSYEGSRCLPHPSWLDAADHLSRRPWRHGNHFLEPA